jgi:hypothetical protein
MNKAGIVVSTIYAGSNPVPPKYASQASPASQDRDGSFNGWFEYVECEFHGFTYSSSEVYSHRAIALAANPDILQPAIFKKSKFVGCNFNAGLYIPNPLDSWAVIRDCGNFPCTGLKNIMLKFEASTWSGDL